MAESLQNQTVDNISPEERRWNNLVDQGIFSPERADLAVYGYRNTAQESQNSDLISKPTRHTSRRGGRSFAEPSDSDLDPAWNPPYVKPDEPEVESIGTSSISPGRRALAAMRAALEMRRTQKIADGEIVRGLAIARAHAERRAKQQL